ncbi:MAG: lipoate--protein ligase family protein, partial [Vicinamibacteria bacterium]
MAVDETLFQSAVEGLAPPTVRFYGWSQPTLSIGFRQELDRTCNPSACRRLGVEAVRRFTGGRAVLHHRELTYCVAASADGPFRGLSVSEAYRWVSGVLRRAFERNGIHVDPAPLSRHSVRRELDDTLPCFAVPTRHEMTSGGRKLVGAAQKWSRRGFVQHGSVLMEIDRPLWSSVFVGLAAEGMAPVGVVELYGRRLSTSRLMSFLGSEFEQTLGEPASQSELLPSE